MDRGPCTFISACIYSCCYQCVCASDLSGVLPLQQENETTKGRIEVSTGITRFSPQGDGYWYQKHAEGGNYKLKLTSPSLSISYVFPSTQFQNLQFSLGAHYYGHYSTRCECYSSDKAYESVLAGKGTSWPLSTFTTTGYAYGISAGGYYNFYSRRTFSFFGGAKILSTATSNKVNISNYHYGTTGPEDGVHYGPATELTVPRRKNWGFGYALTFGIRRNYESFLQIQMSHINPSSKVESILRDPVWTLEVGQRF